MVQLEEKIHVQIAYNITDSRARNAKQEIYNSDTADRQSCNRPRMPKKNSPKNMLLPTIYQTTEIAVADRHGLNTAVNLTGHRTCGFDHLLLYGTLNWIMTK